MLKRKEEDRALIYWEFKMEGYRGNVEKARLENTKR